MDFTIDHIFFLLELALSHPCFLSFLVFTSPFQTSSIFSHACHHLLPPDHRDHFNIYRSHVGAYTEATQELDISAIKARKRGGKGGMGLTRERCRWTGIYRWTDRDHRKILMNYILSYTKRQSCRPSFICRHKCVYVCVDVLVLKDWLWLRMKITILLLFPSFMD